MEQVAETVNESSIRTDIDRIKEAVLRQGLRYDFVAKKAGLHYTVLSGIINNHRPLSENNRRKIFDVLHIPL